MGSDEFSEPVLAALLQSGPALSRPVHVAGVVTQPDRPRGRGRKLEAGPVKRLALEHHVPVLQPERIRNEDVIADLRALVPDVIVVASYGQILPRAVLEIPEQGCLNLHPSLLPRYRGPSPIAGPILAGDEETGTTLMVMVAKMDAGPIVDQARTQIGPEETAGELRARLAATSAQLLLRDLPGWIGGALPTSPQAEGEVTYTSLVRREDALLDWSAPADFLSRQVRAYNPWPVAHSYWNGRLLRILAARPVAGSGLPGEVIVCGRTPVVGAGEGCLELLRVQLAGGRPVSGEELLRGYPAIRGATLEREGQAW
jgi:methionyl-tRNA formyltransferase